MRQCPDDMCYMSWTDRWTDRRTDEQAMSACDDQCKQHKTVTGLYVRPLAPHMTT